MPDESATATTPSETSLDDLMAELREEDLQYRRSADPDVPGRRAKIQINNVPLDEQTSLAIRALHDFNKPPHLFVRSCMISRVRYDERNIALVEPLDQYALRYYLARSAYFIKTTADKKTPGLSHETHFAPPMDVTHDVLVSPDHEFPQLVGLSEIPIIRDDGEVIPVPGYDPITQLYYAPSNGCTFPVVPENPTPADVIVATDLIKEVLQDFPFVDDCSRANAIAAMITPILRPIIQGCVPMAVVDKPQAGTGASLYCDAVSIIATGSEMATITEQKTEEEWQKVLFSLLRIGRVLVTIDNIEGKLHAPTLASLLTCTTYQGRLLGQSEMMTFLNRTVIIANGNNIQLGGDLPRRCFSIRMDAKSAQPWLRKIQFKHPDLRNWAKENRGWLVTSILTLAKSWIRAGRPAPDDLPILGGFEDWCRVVGGILHHAGITGFLGNLESMYENMDQDTQQWEAFFLAWRGVFNEREVGVSEVYDHLKRESDSKESLFREQQLYTALPDWLGDEFNKKTSFVRKLGKALAKKDGVCYSCGLKLERCGTRKRAVLWKVGVWDQELYNIGGLGGVNG